jgi:hypothetical protein
MKPLGSMKIPLISSGLILLIGAGVGWSDRGKLARVRNEIAALKSADPENSVRGGESGRERRPLGRARDIEIAEVIAMAAEWQTANEAGQPMSVEMTDRRDTFLELLSKQDASQIRQFIARVEDSQELAMEQKRELQILSLQKLGARDIKGAFELLREFPAYFAHSRAGQSLVVNLLSRLAEVDPLAAVARMNQLVQEHPELRADRAKGVLICQTSSSDPQLAFKLIQDLIGNEETDRVESIIRDIIQTAKTDEARISSLLGLRGYLATLDDVRRENQLRDIALSGMTRGVGTSGFESSVRWMARAKLEPQEKWGFASGLSQDFTVGETGHWINWLAKEFPVEGLEPAREKQWGDIVRGLIGDWAEVDSAEAGKWLETLPPGEVRDYSVCGFARALAVDHPDIAAQWVKTLQREEDRAQMLRQIHRKIMAEDEDAAASFAERHGVN